MCLEMCVVFENVSNYELEWVISPVTPAYIKVNRLLKSSVSVDCFMILALYCNDRFFVCVCLIITSTMLN